MILEVGNVLSNYENSLSDYLGIRPRRIVDKFEIAEGVENVDILDVSNSIKYSGIVSISTVEHVGQGDPSYIFSEKEKNCNLERPLEAIAKLFDLLDIGGEALISVPFGKLVDYGNFIQFSMAYVELLFDKYGIPRDAVSLGFLKRLKMEYLGHNPKQQWSEVGCEELSETEYGSPWQCANGMLFLRIIKNSDRNLMNNHWVHMLSYATPLLVSSVYHSSFIKVVDQDVNGIFISDNQGFIFYGPYINLPEGEYELVFSVDVDCSCNLKFDVSANCGQDIIYEQGICESGKIVKRLFIGRESKSLELRLYNVSGQKVKVYSNQLTFRKINITCK